MTRIALFLAAALAGGACLAQPANPAPVTPKRSGMPWVDPGHEAPIRDASNMDRTDRKFMGAAAQMTLTQIALGELAAQRAQSPQVREYAKQLVADQRATGARLQKIAAVKRMALPSQPPRDLQGELGSLQKLSGDAFDRRFLDRMVRDHEKAVDLFNQEIKGRHQDVDLKNFAQDTEIQLTREYGAAQRLRTTSGHLPG